VILADTSAWVEFDRATGSAVDRRITELIGVGDALATTEPVMMEVLAGARDGRRERDLRSLLLHAQLIPFDPVADFDSAARIYRQCRAVAITPRGMIDCMIVAVALRTGASLLAQDVDIDRVARTVGVALDDASLRA
jgi:predicted nucleic acid-binding protein